jgi:hypothetical protein
MAEKSKRISGKTRVGKKVGQMAKHGRGDAIVRTRKVVKQDITKEQFLANLGKVCQPISKESSESDSKKSET